MIMSETDVKPKYIDITQLPVSPDTTLDEIRLTVQVRMNDFMGELTALSFGLSPKDLKWEHTSETTARDELQLEQSILEGYRLLEQLNVLRGLCTPSRNPITASFNFDNQ